MPSPKDTKGPIVKTGPTAGQNRSRNEDGQWRKKRSDAGKTRSKQFLLISNVVMEGFPSINKQYCEKCYLLVTPAFSKQKNTLL